MSSIGGLSISNIDLFRASQNSRGEGGIRVDGNRISWSADGWYEVLSASSYNTMSEGGTSATLPHGTYNVINHTTGERFENIVVPSSENARIAEPADLSSSQKASTPQQNQQAESDEGNGQDAPLLTVTIPASTVNNELQLNNGVVVDVEEVTGEPMTDTIIEVRPEDGTDDLGFTQGLAAGGLALGVAPYLIPSMANGFGLLGVGIGAIGAATAFGDFEARPTNPQTGHNSNDEYDSNGDGLISSTESAVNSGFGTASEGEFGGTPTEQPASEPISQPTSSSKPSNANSNGENESNSHGGVSSGGVSSSQSAEQGGYGNNETGEFG